MSTDSVSERGVSVRTLPPVSTHRVSSFQRNLGSVGVLSQAVLDRYRCPADFLDFSLSGDLSGDEGYFRFGRNAICYGRTSAVARRSSASVSLDDAADKISCNVDRVQLPFDPSEIIDNLRLERYFGSGATYQLFLRKLYYSIRPLTNLSVRRRIQRFHARNWPKRVFPNWPVDTTVENLCESLMLLSLQAKGMECVPFIWFWPRGARGCMLMTHDVETKAGLDFCSTFMDIDDTFGIKSSFQIVPEKRYAVPPAILDSIRSRGFEVGVQDLNHDGRLFDNKEEFLRRAEQINRYGKEYGAQGFRAAVLYRKPEWYDALDFAYDMSMPNVAHLDPQRGGCCTVMPYFIGNLLEIPVTTIQDYTLFHLLNENSIGLWKTQAELIAEKHGLASFIVHPDYVIEPSRRRVYEELLGYLREIRERDNIWMALPIEVDHWWRARSKMSLVQEGNSWRIQGDGAERAIIAYAKQVEGRLTYELRA
jgi:hypothetical protein